MTDQDSPATAGLATGSDTGAPGEDSAPPLQPGDDVALAALLETGDGGAEPAVEDDPEMAAAAQEDRATDLLGAAGAPDADTPDFREPEAG